MVQCMVHAVLEGEQKMTDFTISPFLADVTERFLFLHFSSEKL